MIKKICLKCLDVTHFGGEYCTRDGEKLVGFNLLCECGAEIYPHFWTIFPPWGSYIANKHCPGCGRDIRRPVKKYLKELQYEGGKSSGSHRI